MFICQERNDRTRVLEEAVTVFPDGSVTHHGRPEYELEWDDDERFVTRARLTAGSLVMDVEPMKHVYLGGGTGYGFDADWRHGMWQGRARRPGPGLRPDHARGAVADVRHRRRLVAGGDRRPGRLRPVRVHVHLTTVLGSLVHTSVWNRLPRSGRLAGVEGYRPETMGDTQAADYDRVSPRSDTDACVALLAQLAGDGPVLELAVGTGRVALPLAARGLRVDGVEISEAMVAELRRRPGGRDLHVVVGDMATVELGRRYRLVALVFNTLFNLTTEAAQRACVANAARHLTDDGLFVIEAYVPSFERFTDDQYVRTEHLSADEVVLDCCVHRPEDQLLEEVHVVLSEGGGVRLFPVVQRYAWPAELDAMAAEAGLVLVDRWADWERTPFTDASPSHVSAYRPA